MDWSGLVCWSEVFLVPHLQQLVLGLLFTGHTAMVLLVPETLPLCTEATDASEEEKQTMTTTYS